jgi:protocatechuate 3,4-dioxygenase beta subunit
MKKITLLVLLFFMTGCAGIPQQTEVPAQSTVEPTPGMLSELTTLVANTAEVDEVIVITPPAPDDFFSQMGINLPAPTCDGLTPSQTEGPYYTPDTPERNSLLEDGMPGTRLIAVGYVLDQNCQPLPNAWLDFWQADANGQYDNSGFRLRGHQYTDAQGRYYLETVVPGEYPGRTEHIHFKVQPQNGNVLTSQLYFPGAAANQRDGIFDPALIMEIEDRGDYLIGYYNFVVQN